MFMGVGLTIIVGLLSNFNPRPLGAAPQLLVIASVRVESDPWFVRKLPEQEIGATTTSIFMSPPPTSPAAAKYFSQVSNNFMRVTTQFVAWLGVTINYLRDEMINSDRFPSRHIIRCKYLTTLLSVLLGLGQVNQSPIIISQNHVNHCNHCNRPVSGAGHKPESGRFHSSAKHWQWHQQSAKTRSHKYFSTKSATKLCLGRWMAGQIFRC